MGGVEIMMKAFGVDPQKLLADFGQRVSEVHSLVVSFDERLKRIEEILGRLEGEKNE